MAFTKFASLEVLEVKSAPSRVRTASLSKFADFDEYRTDDGYLYVRVRAISSRVNKNHDGWPSSELKKAYRSFIGKPIFVDHHNHDPKRGRGVIVDAALHIEDEHTASLDPYYAGAPAEHLPPTWIELLLEVDAKQYPKLAKAVIEEDIDGVSMGANVEMSKCSHCGNEARSPEEFCKHVQSKGAYFDYYSPSGVKTSKKAYEDCYDIGFFEISFVFDPADETALVSDLKHAAKQARVAAIQNEAGFEPMQCPNCGLDASYAHHGRCPQCMGEVKPITNMYTQPPMEHVQPSPGGILPPLPAGYAKAASTVTAEKGNTPQSDMTSAPTKVDTLRQEQVCPICGSDMEDGVCEVCNYEEPPEGFQNPDLTKAKEVDKDIRQEDAQEAQQGVDDPQGDVQNPQPGPPAPMPSGAMPATSKTAETADVKIEKTAASSGGRINTQERPILPATRQLSDKPIAQKTVTEAKKPVESNTNKETMTDTLKTADGATAQGEGVQADKRVDVEGVGAVSGDPLGGIEHENVEKNTGDFTAPHTDTWSNGEGDSLGQQDAVTSETGELFTVSSEKTAAEAEDNAGEEAGSTGGAEAGGKTWDSAGGFPDHDPTRVDVAAPLKEEVGPGTSTDSSEEFRSLKHTEPVTKEDANSLGGPIGVAVASAKAQMLKAMQVAETEVAAGIREASSKFERVAELEDKSEEVLDAMLETLSSVKTAGLKKTASAPTQKTAGATRMPSFSKTAGFDIEAHAVVDEFEDSIF